MLALSGAAIIVFVLDRENDPVVNLLSHPLLVWVGRISYSLYLWHFAAALLLQSLPMGKVTVDLIQYSVSFRGGCDLALPDRETVSPAQDPLCARRRCAEDRALRRTGPRRRRRLAPLTPPGEPSIHPAPRPSSTSASTSRADPRC